MTRTRRPKKTPFIIRTAARLGYHPGRVMREVLEWIEVLVVAGALAAVIMSTVIVRMHVPTGSMIPTIDPRDSFYVNRLSYWFIDPTPGDIVVFRHTDEVLVRSVAEGSRAELVGIGALIEKAFEGGRAELEGLGVPLHALAVITEMSDGRLVFAGGQQA